MNICDNNNNYLIVMIGAPGSGKSTWSHQFVKNYPDYVMLSSDALRAKFGRDESDQTVTGQVFSYIKNQTEVLMTQKKNIIIDATNIVVRDRKDYIDAANRHGYQKTAVVFEASREILIERNIKRGNQGGRNVPDWVIDKMLTKYQPPTKTEFDNIIYI